MSLIGGESGADLLLRDIRGYVEHHLRDPDLSPTSIAAANHISLRCLQRLFQRDRRTVGAFLRELKPGTPHGGHRTQRLNH